MKDINAKIIIAIIDICAIMLSMTLGYILYGVFDSAFMQASDETLFKYLLFPWVYIVPVLVFLYEGMYTRRFDFWHESRQVVKGLILAFLIVISILALVDERSHYERYVFVYGFLWMFLFVLLFKNITKKTLYHIGLWRREARVIGDPKYIEEEIFGNPYLGYEHASSKNAEVVFINSKGMQAVEVQRNINSEIQNRHKVIFIPMIRDFDYTRSRIYQLSNAKMSLVVLQNRLKSKHRILLKWISDKMMALTIFPLLIPLFIFIAYKIRKEEPEGSIFFTQKRIGKHGHAFNCYKFRTMREDGDEILEAYLKQYPEEVVYYQTYHKYQNDPRITKIGHLLRRTSLDEIPQILNVFKGEMSLVGPRPYMYSEEKKIGDAIDIIMETRPGITGLWQVSGRSDVDFHSRVKLDVWYIRNWSIWLDIMILLKTIKTVLVKNGAS